MRYKHLRQLASDYTLVLGSGSPRRVQLLSDLGISFLQMVANISEQQNPAETPFDYARRLAVQKSTSISSRFDDKHLVLGSDTIVILGDTVLEKPKDEHHAFEILTSLAGKKHTVCTALAFSSSGKLINSDNETTDVFFNQLTPEQIKKYIASGEPSDKAGAYGIQGIGSILVDRIEGNLDNVIGLPLQLLEKMAADIIIL